MHSHFSIVVPTCDRPDLLRKCLSRLAPGVQTIGKELFEVVVTDDGKKTVQDMLSDEFSWVRWTRGPCRGPAANRNHGARITKNKWLIFTDDDCLPEVSWIDEFANGIEPDILVYEGRTTCKDGITSPLMHSPINLSGGCLWSCNFMISRSILQKVNGFDEGFPFPHMEDADLRMRLEKSQIGFKFIPSAIVDHPPRAIACARKRAIQHESWMYHWYKHGNKTWGAPRLAWLIFRVRLQSLLSHRFSPQSIIAIGSFFQEFVELVIRLPAWERKYRKRRF